MDFGATIRSLRKAGGLSQLALANALQQVGIRIDVSYLRESETPSCGGSKCVS
jgi:transcriptional regulator with XRE-family HTH domain